MTLLRQVVRRHDDVHELLKVEESRPVHRPGVDCVVRVVNVMGVVLQLEPDAGFPEDPVENLPSATLACNQCPATFAKLVR